MNIINMHDEYAILCEEAKSLGNFEAYKNYTSKYPYLFDGILRYLYMTDLEHLRYIIEQIDFSQKLQIMQENIIKGYDKLVQQEAQHAADLMGFTEDFDLYLGLDMGSIGGTALPGKPFVYIGFDIPLNDTVKFLVPHECNHMVRICMVGQVDMVDFTERVITEGLGTYCPIAQYGLDISPDTVAMALGSGMPAQKAQALITDAQDLENEITQLFGTPLTQETMTKYFVADVQVQGHILGGYFVGMMIIHRLVKAGHAFAKLTITPADEIRKLYSYLT